MASVAASPRVGPAERDAQAHNDELMRLRQENASLKKHSVEQGDTVKNLSVQMVRIRNEMLHMTHVLKCLDRTCF